ncbi:hypothetical protein ACH5RR_002784 [Cinchona calisaya]|uniref:NAC domain-containing protein n=1 Tax=Cinchona calisaya TaxID=153742 RepID=A0ABD3ASY8_9GENT
MENNNNNHLPRQWPSLQRQHPLLQLPQPKSQQQPLHHDMPPGYRFRPNDEELILHYLRKRLENCPLLTNTIHEDNIYDHNPRDLTRKYPLDGFHNTNRWYFFTLLKNRYPKGTRPSRSCATGGFWKPTGKDKEICYQKKIIGYKKSLDFLEGCKPGEKTGWKMHEYRIGANGSKLGTVLCKLYLNKKKHHEQELDDEEEMAYENLDQDTILNAAPILQNQENTDLVRNILSSASSTNNPCMQSFATQNSSSNSGDDASSSQVLHNMMPNSQFYHPSQNFQGYNNYYHGGFENTSQNSYVQFDHSSQYSQGCNNNSHGVTRTSSNLKIQENPNFYLDDPAHLSNLASEYYWPTGFMTPYRDDFPKAS